VALTTIGQSISALFITCHTLSTIIFKSIHVGFILFLASFLKTPQNKEERK